MSKLLSLWKKKDPIVDQTPNVAFRKIHPNLDSLAVQSEDGRTVRIHHRDALDFIPLKPKPPERDRCNSMSLQLPELQVPRVAPFGPDDVWSTFGRNIKPPTESEEAQAPDSIPSTFHCQGSPVTHRYMHLQTPTSMSRSSKTSSPLSQSTQHNCTSSSSHNDSASIPRTSEKRFSPASYHTFGRRSSSRFLAETPPPLPPLDHPAFAQARECNRTLEKQPRHSASLPIIPRKRRYEIRNSQIEGKRKSSHERRYMRDSNLSILGKPCGGNVSSLGDPFLLQSALSHRVPHSDRHGNNADFPFIHDRARSGNGEYNKIYEMNQSDIKKTPVKPVFRPQRSSPPKQGPALLVPPSLSFTSPTPGSSPITPSLPLQSSQKGPTLGSNLQGPSPALQSSLRSTTGKRKADDAEVEGSTPSKDNRRATFAHDQRPHRVSENSGSSYAPSSYKRVRLSTSSDSRPTSRTPTTTSFKENLGSGNTGSWSSRGSMKRSPLDLPHRQPSRHSVHSHIQRSPREPSRRRSLSGASIPISALVSPHAPSVARSTTFHMRNPHRPGPIQSTSWVLSLPVPGPKGSRWVLEGWVERGGSPVHAWLFLLGFLFFPLWWAAAFVVIPKTRKIGEGGMEKGVILDDPQVEHDSRSWRTRCRIMALISFFTYIPFIILIAIFVRH